MQMSWLGRWAIGRRSLPLSPSSPGSGLFPALLVCLPPAKAVSWKSLWGGDRKSLGGGQTEGGQIKAGGLSEGWLGTRDRELKRGPEVSRRGSPPTW